MLAIYFNSSLAGLAALSSTSPAVTQVVPQELDCAYHSPTEWRTALRSAVARGEIADPALRVVPPIAARTSPAVLDPEPCLGPAHIFLYEDTQQLLLTDYADIDLYLLMADAANALMAAHGDNFDFVGYWLNFTPHHQGGLASYTALENDVLGIGNSGDLGKAIFNYRPDIGLGGDHIEGWVMMNDVNSIEWQPGADFVRLVMCHEFEHRFGVFLEPLLDGRKLQGENNPCGRDTHWNWKIDGQGSAMELSEWVGASPASLQGYNLSFNTDIGGAYSYVDLYLMGYVSPAEMDSGNSELRYMDTSHCQLVYPGTISTFASADIIAIAGSRIPDSTTAQKDFRAAWVMFHQPGSPPTGAELDKAVQILQQHQTDHRFGTLGRGSLTHTLFDDCNCNGVPDADDIVAGTSLDGNDNGQPDECEPTVGTIFCSGDGSLATACPCSNFGAPAHGCASSVNAAGAVLSAFGATDPDSVALDVSGAPAATLAIFFKGDADIVNGVVFGDGVRCAGGQLVRFGQQITQNGTAIFPGASATSVSAVGGTPPGSGLVGYYQAFYRDSNAVFCPAATFNATNGVRVVW